jgi:N4-gp56 family major capsid protein
MAWTTTTLTVSDVADSVITRWDEGVMLGYTPELIVNQVATINVQANAKVVQFTKYSNLTQISSALTEDADATSVVLVDTAYTLTPLEYGNTVTSSKLVDFQTNGKGSRAAALVIGRNMGSSVDKLGVTALEAHATTVIWPNAITATTSLGASDNLDRVFAGRLYNKLARNNVPGINGQYIGIAHDDCLYDLREALVPVAQYQGLTSVLQNEVGMAAGIRWLRSSNISVSNGGGAGAVDSYAVPVVGANALGLAISEAPHPVITGPYDKLNRFLNIGWYGCFVWGLLDTGNMCLGQVASSVGANT